MGQAIAKCEEYHDWGVAYTWIVDPVEKRAWEYHRGSQLAEVTGALTAGTISVSCPEVF